MNRLRDGVGGRISSGDGCRICLCLDVLPGSEVPSSKTGVGRELKKGGVRKVE